MRSRLRANSILFPLVWQVAFQSKQQETQCNAEELPKGVQRKRKPYAIAHNQEEGKMVMLSLLVRKLKEELDETVYLDSRILMVLSLPGVLGCPGSLRHRWMKNYSYLCNHCQYSYFYLPLFRISVKGKKPNGSTQNSRRIAVMEIATTSATFARETKKLVGLRSCHGFGIFISALCHDTDKKSSDFDEFWHSLEKQLCLVDLFTLRDVWNLED
ncbi:hypothetical protein AAG906_013600 [Vitis piasezkii]